MTAGLHILYLVHDVSDPAVARRCAMLKQGGATVTIAGFRRTPKPIAILNNTAVIDLGQTRNGGFIQRVLAVLRIIGSLHQQQKLLASADCILARNLEMLAIGVRAKKLCKPSPSLIYECLDIHRLMLGKGTIGKTLRKLEGWLCKSASALFTSSPAFIHEYFEKRSHVRLPTYLIENKLFPESAAAPIAPRSTEKPWVIGWFGAIRCQKSLDILEALTKETHGSVQIIIRGRPALDQFRNFETQIKNTPSIHFKGAYTYPDDLQAIYSEVHFTWAIDMFEEGLNSSWLLPNRLYEGCAFAAVPLAAAGVETSRTLERMGIGHTLAEPKLASLKQFFATLIPENYELLEAAIANKPKETWIATPKDCAELVGIVRNFSPTILRKNP